MQSRRSFFSKLSGLAGLGMINPSVVPEPLPRVDMKSAMLSAGALRSGYLTGESINLKVECTEDIVNRVLERIKIISPNGFSVCPPLTDHDTHDTIWNASSTG